MTKSAVEKSWWIHLLRGVPALVFGLSVLVTAILFPSITVQALVLLFGAYLVVTGTAAAIGAVYHRPESLWGALLVNGLLNMTLGMLALIWTGVTATALVLGFALWMIVSGLLDVVSAVRLRRVGDRPWNMAFSGVASLVVGTLVIAYPSVGVLGVMWLIGGFAAVSGLLSIGFGLRIRSYLRKAPPEREAPPRAESEPA